MGNGLFTRPAVRRALGGICMLALPAAVALGRGKEFHRVFEVGPESALSVQTHTGSIRVEGTAGHHIAIDASIEGREKDVNAFSVSADQSGGHVEVRGVLGSSDEWPWYSPDLTVTITVTVPRECTLKLHTSEGYIEVHNVRGAVSGSTSMGDVTLSRTDGDVDFEAVSGCMSADTCTGALTMRATAGGIRLVDVHGDVNVSTSAGDISLIDVDGGIRAESAGGNIALRLTGPNRGIHAETSGGDVDVALPASVPGAIDAQAGGGIVSCTLDSKLAGEVQLRQVNAKINGGGREIYLHTMGGNVRIHGLTP